ncbi:MAG TPA: hypothetical protein VGG03_07715 [Thermoanaerobaculia bacterium]|jgi:hypothetical protein
MLPPFKTAEVLDSIAGVLSPYLGKMMAQASASAHCKDLQIGGDLVDRQKVDALVERLGKGLNLFLGRDKSKLVVEEMRRALDRLGGGPLR